MRRLRTPHSLATIAALLAVTAALAACGEDGSGGNAQDAIDSATLEGVESGKLDLALKLSAKGENGGNLDLSVSAAFQGEGQGELPQLDGTATAKGTISGEKVDFEGGLVLLPDSAYVSYEGTTYEVDPTTFSFFESALEQAQREGGGEGEDGSTSACQEEFGELELSELVSDAASEGSAEVGGESTTKFSGELDVPAALEQAVEIAQSPACSAQAGAVGGLPSGRELEEAEDEVRKSVKSAKVELYVGDDDIVRRLVVDLTIEPAADGDGPDRAKLELDLRLTEVNEEQRISAPGGRKKPLGDLFLELDVNPIELLEQLQGEGEAGQFDLEGLLGKLGDATR